MFQFSNHIFNITGIERGKERENRKENARCVHVQPNVMNNRQISRAGLGQDESIDSSWPRVWYDTVVLWMTTYMFKLFRGRFQSYWIYKLYTMRTWTLLSSSIKIYQIRLDQAKWNNSINNYFCFRDHISFHNILSNQFSALWRIDCADCNVRVSIKLGHPQPVSIHFMKKGAS